MPNNKVYEKLKEAVEAQKRLQASAKAVKAEIERAKTEALTE